IVRGPRSRRIPDRRTAGASLAAAVMVGRGAGDDGVRWDASSGTGSPTAAEPRRSPVTDIGANRWPVRVPKVGATAWRAASCRAFQHLGHDAVVLRARPDQAAALVLLLRVRQPAGEAPGGEHR